MSMPKLRFPEFRDEREWGINCLIRIADRITQRNSDNNVSRVLSNSAVDGVVDQRDYFDKDIANQDNLQNYFIVDKGDYVYNPRVSTTAPVGPISKNKIGKGLMSPLYTVFRFHNSMNDFFEHFFHTNIWHKYLKEVSNSGARHDRMALSNEDFMNMPLPLPNHREQQKIADCLSSLDALIAAHNHKLTALKTHKKGLMQQLFPAEGETVPRLRFPKFRDEGEWEEKELIDLLSDLPDYGLNAPSVPFTDTLPTYLRITDIDDEGRFICETKVSVECDISEKDYLRNRQIVLARTGASVGKSYRYNPDDGNLVFAGYLIRIKPNDLIDSIYLSHYLHTDRYWKWVGITSMRSGQPGINSTEYSKLLIPIPPTTSEQQKIADCLSSLDNLITAQGQKIEALKQHKKGLMQQLFPQLAEDGV